MRTTLQVLSADERRQLHDRTLHLLATTGMRVDTAQGRTILADAGAEVDEATRIVRFPEELVEASLRLAPKVFSLGGRRPGWEFVADGRDMTLVGDGEATRILDHGAAEPRPGTRADWQRTTELIDAVDDIGVYWGMIEGSMSGDSIADWVDYNITLARTFSKHIQDSFSDPSWVPWLLEVLEIVYGGREEVRRRHPYSFLMTPVSPLVIEEACTDTWLALRGWDIPVAVLPMPIMGATGPGSMLGTTLLANAETLGVLCLVQAADPGTPFIYAPIALTMEPRSGRYAGTTTHSAIGVAGVEMARHYGLPVMGSASGTDAFVAGEQAGLEKAFSSLMGTLAWPDLMVGPGCYAGAMVLSHEELLIDVEIFRMCRKARQGITVDDDHWLDDVVARVGPGGHFVAERTTRANTRNGEWFLPGLGVHDAYESWLAAGRRSLLDEAHERVEALLAARQPLPLGEEVERELAKVRAAAKAAAKAAARTAARSTSGQAAR
jgi:trimethylamine---corrinoid protein Co-methyltransferase